MTYSRLTVIIPTLNEVDTVPVLLRQLVERFPGVRAAVVDDCSTDGTQQAVDALRLSDPDLLDRLRLIERRGAAVAGLTASVIDGIRACRTEYFVVMDGDLQHPPAVVEELFSALESGAELTIGSRLPYQEKQPLHRTAFTEFARLASRLFLRRAGIALSDPMSGFFGGRTALVREIIQSHEAHFELRGYKVLFDLLRAGGSRLNTREVFYHFGVRSGGHSKLKGLHAWCFLRSLLGLSGRTVGAGMEAEPVRR